MRQSHAALRNNRSAARHPPPRLQSAWGLARRAPALRVVPRAGWGARGGAGARFGLPGAVGAWALPPPAAAYGPLRATRCPAAALSAAGLLSTRLPGIKAALECSVHPLPSLGPGDGNLDALLALDAASALLHLICALIHVMLTSTLDAAEPSPSQLPAAPSAAQHQCGPACRQRRGAAHPEAQPHCPGC